MQGSSNQFDKNPEKLEEARFQLSDQSRCKGRSIGERSQRRRGKEVRGEGEKSETERRGGERR